MIENPRRIENPCRTEPRLHNFRERLEWGECQKDEPFWDVVYRKAFPNLVNHMPTPGDVASQRMGIDRVVFLANGRSIMIDEKKRGKEYNDILLEYVSVDTTGAAGWIEKDLAIDFLAYAFVPSGRCYLFSWPLLRQAWENNKTRWKAAYRPVVARNRDYSTYSLPIPIPELQRSIARCSVIDVQPSERINASHNIISEQNENIDAALSPAAPNPFDDMISDYEARAGQWDDEEFV